ncbi:hypothetical protein BU52_13295 [Streptomyces toyocaensis]|uniref:Uncharacterized protein n=1 Tax=Streptomyces toyocaensis TaxID=55952 RepID=A0A081XT82_STRTO|nr:hypothetical protein [Streptomyces toyocaensis]KES06755.1 hypothetical protein BU52_13295 [Streptomyces toyocaensis]
MGERRSDGGRAGRRRAHPEGTAAAQGRPAPVLGGRRAVDAAELEALLAAALIRGGVDAGAEERAVAAFVAARESGAHGARTRRRDDWRARRWRFGSHSLKATLSALVAGLTLSGVAVAGIGVTGSSTDGPAEDGRSTRVPSDVTAPATPKSAGPGAGSGRPDPDHPGTARDTEAHCRAYEQVGGRGEALDATAWKRLTEAAGGAARVDAYCADRLEPDTARPSSTGTPGNGNTDGTDRAGNGAPGNTGEGAPGTPGDAADGNAGSGAGPADDAAGADNADNGENPDAGSGGVGGSGAGKPADQGAQNP